MSDDKEITRREAIKNIGVGVSVIAVLPVLGQEAAAHDHAHPVAQQATKAKPQRLRFFTAAEEPIVGLWPALQEVEHHFFVIAQ